MGRRLGVTFAPQLVNCNCIFRDTGCSNEYSQNTFSGTCCFSCDESRSQTTKRFPYRNGFGTSRGLVKTPTPNQNGEGGIRFATLRPVKAGLLGPFAGRRNFSNNTSNNTSNLLEPFPAPLQRLPAWGMSKVTHAVALSEKSAQVKTPPRDDIKRRRV